MKIFEASDHSFSRRVLRSRLISFLPSTFPSPNSSSNPRTLSLVPLDHTLQYSTVTIEVVTWTTTAVATALDDHVATGLPVDDIGAFLDDADYSNAIRQVDYISHVIVMPWLLSIGFINQCVNVLTLSRLLCNGLNGFQYLRASAVIDILSIVATVPFVLRHAELHNQHSYLAMFYHAHIELPLINSLITASALCIVAMTFDRCSSIFFPIRFHRITENQYAQRIRITIPLLFLLSVAVFFPSAWERKLEAIADTANGTIWMMTRNKELNGFRWFQAYLIGRELIARLGPIVILVLLNFLISHRIRKMHPTMKRQSVRRRCHKHVRITRLLTITSSTFIICTLPASLLSIFINNATDSLGLQIFRAVANLLQVTSYLYNLFLYMLFSSEYRKEFLTLLRCSDRQRTTVTTGEATTYKFSTAIFNRTRSYRPAVWRPVDATRTSIQTATGEFC